MAEPDPRLAVTTDAPQPVARGVVSLGVPADLLRARPDIRRAELAVVGAAAELGVARADLWPRLTLGGGLTVTGTAVGASLLSPAGPILSAVGGPSLSIPLFDWGARRAAVEARGARLGEASLAYRQAVLEAAEEVEAALATLGAEGARAERLELAEASARRALRSAEALYRQGLVSALDLIQAEGDLLRAGVELAGAREGEALAVVALHKALVGGAEPPIRTELGR
jgi:outer membrane protein TolC